MLIIQFGNARSLLSRWGTAFVPVLFAAAAVLCVSLDARSQTAASTPEPAKPAVSSPDVVPGDKQKAPDRAKEIKRWFEFDDLTINARYRYSRNAFGNTVSNQLQWRFTGKARFKFDRKGKYSVVAGLYTGNSFTGGWNTTGWGTGSRQTNLYLKQLYFDAKPVKAVEIQFGGIGINNGENTEATGYDNDAYITGERVIIRHPKKLYFDEISLTNAHIGDFNRPSVFRRFDNLAKSNYHQFLVRKQASKRIGFSADYTFDNGSDTFRQAVKIKTPETRIADFILFENYQRFDGPGRYGFNVFGERKIGKKLTLDLGFAHIDGRLLNGDRYPQGNLIHANASYKFSPEFSFTAFAIHGVGPMLGPLPRTRVDLIFTYNVLETLRRHKLQ